MSVESPHMWVWERADWPNFVVDASEFSGRVEAFRRTAERLSGQVEALSDAYQTDAVIELMLSEVIATSAIEGENLDRDSVRSSLLMHFGRAVDAGTPDDRAAGATDLIVAARRNWNLPLSHETLGRWQSRVIAEQPASTVMRGAYRNRPEPMQIVSGRYIGRPQTVHYEAPPAAEVAFVMGKTRFYDRYGENLNGRQHKMIARLFAEGRSGFAGGLSAKNSGTIAKCSPATATRDLAALRDMGALVSYGQGRGLRYEIACPEPPSVARTIDRGR